MTLISVHQITKSFASKNLFKKISFSIDSNQRIGLVGPNGAGKSTLFKILINQIQADDGKISFSNSLRLGYLSQKPEFGPDEIIYDCLMSQVDDPYDGLNIAYAYELITKLSLDIHPEKEFAKISELSGGWQKRVALARELMKKPNLLLLDEPTNHLDIQSILWLEEFINAQNDLSFMIITHDRAFLQNTCNMMFDLDPRNPDGLIKSNGSYVQFLETKSMLMDSQKRLEDKKRNTMLIEKDWLARGPQARLTKQKARINRAHDLIDEVDNLENKNQVKKVDFDFGVNQNSPKKLVELKNLSKRYNDESPLLFSKLDAMIRPGSRIGLLGKNGCGKSTLIQIILGHEQPSTGVAFLNPDIQVCYFEQGKETLNSTDTVLKVICPEGDYVHLHGLAVFARSYLSRFYFTNQQMDMPVHQLSGGEQSRLLIAKLMLNPAHVLILDEPTNDLDVETLDVLSDCLSDFAGAIILVSHDRFFLDQNSNEIWAFTENGAREIIKFADYNQWLDWYQTAGKNAAPKVDENKKSDSKKSNKKLSFKELHEFQNIESIILEKESYLKSKQQELVQPEVSSNFKKLNDLTSEISKLEPEIQKLYARWQELEKKVQE
ncbi:MAG: ABC-F family ATP-binding cassette domain-containing protein [Moraxellaceae bacterium]|nr:ABC-F family ATP-binding cassette domain-containing protein [Pseudobdellovibrionaceae bacterium]